MSNTVTTIQKQNPYLELAKSFFSGSDHPLFSQFGVEVEEISQGRAVMSMPYAHQLANGDGCLHSGVISTLLDTNCGLAIFAYLADMKPIATIDLRVDFIREPQAGDGIFTDVECYATEGDLAYVTGRATTSSDCSLVATVTGCFAINTMGPSFRDGNKGPVNA
ncbi:MAG: PaaI family thioesterase [Salinisphaeraceae bacterium]|nr:PaaI family thioesterase [Salinisphaeraceae bacterium]